MSITKKLGIFGGAFDPVHAGHIHAARLARRELSLDKIYFLPLGQAVHKNQPRHSASERLVLLQAAVQPYDFMAVCTADIERADPSYAVDTVEYLQKQPDFTGADLYYIIGADAFAQIFSWKEPYRLLALLKFIVVARPGYDFVPIERRFAREENFLDKIFLIEDAGVDLSSTQINKQRSANGNGSF